MLAITEAGVLRPLAKERLMSSDCHRHGVRVCYQGRVASKLLVTRKVRPASNTEQKATFYRSFGPPLACFHRKPDIREAPNPRREPSFWRPRASWRVSPAGHVKHLANRALVCVQKQSRVLKQKRAPNSAGTGSLRGSRPCRDQQPDLSRYPHPPASSLRTAMSLCRCHRGRDRGAV